MMAKGVEYLLRARRLFANEEGIAHYQRGIAPVTMLQTTPRPAQMELALQPAPVIPLIGTRSFSGAEIAQAYRRATELARSVEALPERVQSLASLL